eukprot:TRINITY_DN20248_c0_g1_i1.p1 TRINITY_DN20248_c0_g1~~TRINITY_DN20248_c0_g1_i1.p1  ORF type:complete len:324 (-),score=64.67 TRINITY_DN20248_c0_g1_i1:207-1178(-)
MGSPLCSRQLRRWVTGFLMISSLMSLLPIASHALIDSDEVDSLSSDEFEGGVPKAYSTSQGEDLEGSNFGTGFGSGSKKSGRGDKPVIFTLQHDLGYGFVAAGEITARVKTSIQGGQKFAKTANLERKAFSADDKAAFEDLVAKGGYYRVRLPANILKPSKANVMASTKARCLAAASFQETLEIHVDHMGNVVGFSYKPKADCSKEYSDTLVQGEFGSSVAVSHAKIAPRLLPAAEQPAGAGAGVGMGVNMAKAGRSNVAGAPGEKAPEPEKTFWQKYWLYIIAGGMLVMNVMTTLSAMPEEAPPGAGAARSGGGAAAGARRR